MKNKTLEASYTLEATFIMSILIFVIFALIHMAFYLHDKSIIQGTLDNSVIKLSALIKHDGRFEEGKPYYDKINEGGIFNIFANYTQEIKITQAYIYNKLEGKLIIGRIERADVDIKGEDITISIKVNMQIPFKRVKQFFEGTKTELVLNARGTIHNPTDFIRQFDCKADVITRIKGGDKIVESLSKIIN